MKFKAGEIVKVQYANEMFIGEIEDIEQSENSIKTHIELIELNMLIIIPNQEKIKKATEEEIKKAKEINEINKKSIFYGNNLNDLINDRFIELFVKKKIDQRIEWLEEDKFQEIERIMHSKCADKWLDGNLRKSLHNEKNEAPLDKTDFNKISLEIDEVLLQLINEPILEDLIGKRIDNALKIEGSETKDNYDEVVNRLLVKEMENKISDSNNILKNLKIELNNGLKPLAHNEDIVTKKKGYYVKIGKVINPIWQKFKNQYGQNRKKFIQENYELMRNTLKLKVKDFVIESFERYLKK